MKQDLLLTEDVWYDPRLLDLEMGGVLCEDAAREEKERQERESLLLEPTEEAET